MAENTGIEWATHTFNPWTGCTKVSEACDFCYAEAWADRSGHVTWGPQGERRRTKTWGNPVKRNKALEGTGRRERVFCASLADFADNHKSIKQEWRDDLMNLIDETPNLDWLLLTKRPQNVMKFYDWGELIPQNVWIGTTVENQKTADQRIPHLLEIPCAVRFLSCEPLVGPVDLNNVADIGDSLRPDYLRGRCINWVITGGESGPNFRPANPDWFRSLRDQCADAEVPFLFKQWEGVSQHAIKKLGRELDGVIHDGYPLAA